jgi:hypothetical protein
MVMSVSRHRKPPTDQSTFSHFRTFVQAIQKNPDLVLILTPHQLFSACPLRVLLHNLSSLQLVAHDRVRFNVCLIPLIDVLSYVDFIDRCQPPANATDPHFGLTTWTICTQTDSYMLKDGFRSFFSGHSSSRSDSCELPN